MVSMRRRLILMLALILLITQLISAFWLWHESQEQISFLVDETLSAKVRNERVDTEIAEAIASLLAPSLIMMTITLLLSFWAISWIIRPLDQLQQKLAERSADNLTPVVVNSDMQEIVSVTSTLNQLLSRLSNTIAQERLFTADAAHELRTPLAGIRLHLELMEQQGITESKSLISRIDLLMHTIEQLLMLSRAGQNFASGLYQTLDWIGNVVQPLKEELEEMCAQRQQILRWELPSDAQTQGDATLLRLMLRNLVENAHRYSPVGSQISVKLSSEAQGTMLQVMDEGPGIKQEQAGELTQAFRRMDQRYGGSGLGLNIVIRIAQLHQGRLTLENRSDRSGLKAQCWITGDHTQLNEFINTSAPLANKRATTNGSPCSHPTSLTCNYWET
ncbi:two-component system sensor histidine kinase PmrB [Yersinia enterocolitica]